MNWLRTLWPGRAAHAEGEHIPGPVIEVNDQVVVEPTIPMVTAVGLWNEWNTNVVDAENRWGGRPIRIVGRAVRVEPRGRSAIALIIEVDRRWRAICCTFPETLRGQLVGVCQGDDVAVVGTVRELWCLECVVDAEAVECLRVADTAA